MKKLIYTLTLFLSIQFFCKAQQWQLNNPYPTAETLTDTQFMGPDTGFAVGTGGLIMATYDGGTNWQYKLSSTYEALKGLHVVSNTIAYACGNNGTILKSSNRGNSWVVQNSGTTNTLNDIYFTSETTGYAAGLNGTIVKTEDGGTTWQTLTTGTTWSLNCIFFSSSQIGYAAGLNGNMYKTMDAGTTWTPLTTNAGEITSMYFLDNNKGFIVSSGVYMTTNGGATWTKVFDSSYYLKKIWFQGTTGYAAGSGTWSMDIIIRSTNGGTSWSYITTSDPGKSLFYCGSGSGSTVYLMGGSGIIYKSENGGDTWEQKSFGNVTQASLDFIFFANEQVGYTGGTNGLLLKTGNGGKSWHSIGDQANSIYSAYFTHPDTGIVVGQWGYIGRTVDGGLNWTTITSGTTQLLSKVIFTSSKTGYIIGGSSSGTPRGYILKTTDGGLTWQTVRTSTVTWYLDGFFLNDMTGIVTGSAGSLLTTSDGGATWTSRTSGASGSINSAWFTDATTGYVCGAGGYYAKSINGGSTWTRTTIPGVTSDFHAIRFTDANTGYMVGDQGTVLKTTDAGATWYKTTLGGAALLDLFFINERTGYCVNGYGGIYSTDNSGLSVVSGKIFNDENGDCVINELESGIANIVVKAEPGPQYTSTESDGSFTFYLPEGNHTITQIIPEPVAPTLEQLCPSGNDAIQVITDAQQTPVDNVDFGDQGKVCPYLTIDLVSNRRRRCAVSYTRVEYCNKGYADAENVKIKLVYPEYVVLQSSSIPWESKDGNVYTYDIGNLPAFACGTFTIQDSVTCGNEAIRGLTVCTEAYIYPRNNCTTPPLWDKADLETSGSCLTTKMQFKISNTGEDMADSTSYSFFYDDTKVFTGKVKLLAGDDYFIDVPAQGKTVRLEVSQTPYHPESKISYVTIEGCGGLPATVSKGFVNQYSNYGDRSDEAISCLPIRDSYDPNDKQSNPEGIGSDHFIPSGQELEYQIRFQNTGSDTAYFVMISDTLSDLLDINTFQAGLTSHPGTLRISGSGNPILTWSFRNIDLPDSITDPSGSMGFVKFKIKPMSGLPQNTVIENTAGIYFDYNSPVITNTSELTINDNLPVDFSLGSGIAPGVVSSVSDKNSSENVHVKVSPNPFADQTTITLSGEYENDNLFLTLFDLHGTTILTMENKGSTSFVITRKQIPMGIYFYRISDSKNILTTGKLVVTN